MYNVSVDLVLYDVVFRLPRGSCSIDNVDTKILEYYDLEKLLPNLVTWDNPEFKELNFTPTAVEMKCSGFGTLDNLGIKVPYNVDIRVNMMLHFRDKSEFNKFKLLQPDFYQSLDISYAGFSS